MTLVTGTPLGNIDASDEIYIEGAPNCYFQDYTATEQFNPDGAGFYYGLSGTTALPVYELGCVSDCTFGDNVTSNDIRCDTVGNKGVIAKRDYLTYKATLTSLLPLATLRHIIRASPVTSADGTEKMGIGAIDNTKYYHVYLPKVYDDVTWDWLSITGHKCQFYGNFEIAFKYGEAWSLPIEIRMYADTTMPSAQQFATVVRVDPSAIA